jgi:arsenite-transporting ATPase
MNRVIPDGEDPWRAGWAAAQRERLAEARESFLGVPLRTVPYLPAEPVGMKALAELGETLYGGADPVAAVPSEPPLRIEGRVLSLALPLTEKSEIGLARVADDLVVTVAGRRRVLALPEPLRRCEVAGASLRAGRLEVEFRSGGRP